ncbi:MAG: thioredoxin family protein [Granulosicoccus sp.]|nr:thioredoxin family protein [Granulosicoccus sp.]
MVVTESSNLPIGAEAPEFTLPDTREASQVQLSSYAGQPLLIVFMCNHCPYVIHILEELVTIAREFDQEGVRTIAISANDIVNYPQDAPAKMAALAQRYDVGFPYCFDETQSVARAYGAVCTPDIFLFDSAHRLYYHGQFDETRPGNGKAHGTDLRQACASLLQGKAAPTGVRPSVGCSIKWKS